MEAVAERTDYEKVQQEIRDFRPPQVRVGRIVRWFREGDRNCQGYWGYVKGVGQRALKMRVVNDDTPWDLTGVHHIDDPELKHRPALGKNSGAWDFLPEDKERDEKILALEKVIDQKERMNSERIAALAKRLDTLESELGVKKAKP